LNLDTYFVTQLRCLIVIIECIGDFMSVRNSVKKELLGFGSC
jgi:hypothetical protein